MDPQVEPQAPLASAAPPGTPAAAARAEFSGAPTEEAVIRALEEGFRPGAALNTAHGRAVRAETVPLARTLSEHWRRLRDRARGRTRPAQARKPTGHT